MMIFNVKEPFANDQDSLLRDRTQRNYVISTCLIYLIHIRLRLRWSDIVTTATGLPASVTMTILFISHDCSDWAKLMVITLSFTANKIC